MSYHSAFDKALKSYAGKLTPQLTSEQVEMIVSAYATGKVPSSIAEHFEAVSKIATEEVQIKFGLPNTWFKGTTNLEDLKPVNLGIATPVAINKARADFVLGNVEQMINDISTAVQKVLGKLPPDDPSKLALRDYQTVIAQAIRDLKAILREIQIKDAEKSKDIEVNRASMTETRDAALAEDIKKQKEIQQQQEKANRLGFLMKIIGPIIAAVCTIIGALLAVFTFGASTALIVAGVAVGVAMTAYSVVDSFTGCTAKIVQAVNDALKNRFPDDEVLQKVVKWLIMSAVIIVLIIAVVFTGGGAAASIASQTAAQVAKSVVMEAIKQLSLQVMVMTVMASNAVPELLGAILKAHGVDKDTSKVLEMVMMMIQMVVVMAAMVKAGGAGATSAAKTGTAAGIGVVETVKQIGNQILTTAKELMARMKEGAEEAVKALVQFIKELINKLVALAKEIPVAIKGAFEEIVSAASSLLKAINEGRGVEFIGAAVKRFGEALKEFARMTATQLEKVMEESIEILKKVGGKALETLKETGDGFAELGRGLRDILRIRSTWKELAELQGLATKSAEQLKKIEQLTKDVQSYATKGQTSLNKTIQLTQETIGIADGITQGYYGLEIAKLLRQVGELNKAEELLEAIIAQLNKLLQSLSTAMDSNMEALKGLNQFLTNFWASQSEMSSKFARPVQG